MSLVTFIVPTLWRPTLKRTVDSIAAQEDPDWKLVVRGDGNGLDPERPDDFSESYVGFTRNWYHDPAGVEVKDPRMHFFWGVPHWSAGECRNAAMHVMFANGWDSEFTAFVDDDDWITPDYVWLLREYVEHHDDADVVVFRMQHPVLGVVPRPGDDGIRHGNVGISYAVKTDIFEQDLSMRFVREDLRNEGPEGNEDIQLVRRLEREGYKIVVVPSVTYHVGNPVTVRS